MNLNRLIWPRRYCPQCHESVNRVLGTRKPLSESTTLSLLAASPDVFGLVAIVIGLAVGYIWGVMFAAFSIISALVIVFLLEAKFSLYKCPACKKQYNFQQLLRQDNGRSV